MTLATIAPAHAVLVDRGAGLVEGSDRDITWLADPSKLPDLMHHADAAQFAAGVLAMGVRPKRTRGG